VYYASVTKFISWQYGLVRSHKKYMVGQKNGTNFLYAINFMKY